MRIAEHRDAAEVQLGSTLLGRELRTLAICLLAAALVVALILRFSNLAGESEMSSDEGADWAAASAPTLSEVQQLGVAFNAGKLALYDVVLHFWIEAFGESLTSMRALSAVLGVLDVLLLSLAIREMFRGWSAEANPRPPNNAATIAILGAVIVALNVTMVKYAREIRMYPLVLALILLQVWWFFRTVRQGAVEDYVNLALLSALALAANFTSALVFAAEGVWLLPSVLGLTEYSLVARRRAYLLIAAVAGGGAALLLPLVYESGRLFNLIKLGEFVFIPPISLRGVFVVLWDAIGRTALFVVVPLAIFGTLRGWCRAPQAISFLVCWFCVPILLAIFVSYLVTPFWVERYVLSSFLPLLVLAGLGLLELPTPTVALAGLALVVLLEAVDTHYYDRSKSDYQWGVQWREAALAAAATNASVGVEPPIAHHVVQYYLRRSPVPPAAYQNNFVGGREGEVLIVADQIPISQPREAADLLREFSKTVARLNGVSVVERQ